MKIHTFVYSLRNVQTKYTYCVLSVFWNVNGYTYPRLLGFLFVLTDIESCELTILYRLSPNAYKSIRVISVYVPTYISLYTHI